MSKEERRLTIAEALAEGFSLCGYDGKDFQNLHKVSQMSPADFEDFANRKIVLADKEPTYLSVNAKDLHERISEELMDNSDFHDDTDDVPDAVEGAVNWEEIAEKINTALRSRPYYYLTQIQLITNP